MCNNVTIEKNVFHQAFADFLKT